MKKRSRKTHRKFRSSTAELADLRRLRQHEWLKNVLGPLRFLEELKATVAVHGAYWKEGMRKYYYQKALQLLNNPPRHMKPTAKKLLERLKKV